MSKKGKLVRSGLAVAVAVAFGGLVYTNYAHDGLGAGAAQTAADTDTGANDPDARRIRRHWLATVTPPAGAAPASPGTIAAAARDPHMLILQSGLFDPLDARRNAPNAGVTVSRKYAIVQFAEGASDARAALERAGATILGYVPNNAYLVQAGRGGIDALQSLKGVRWAGGYRSDMKLSASLLSRARNDKGGDGERSQLELSLFNRKLAQQTAQSLAAQIPDARILHVIDEALSSVVRVEVGNATLAQALSVASQLDAVQYISDYMPPRDLNSATIPVLQSNYSGIDSAGSSNQLAGPTPLWAQGLIGGGQIVGLLDGSSGLVDNDEAWFAYYGAGEDGKVARVTALTNIAAPAAGAELALGPLYPQNKIIGMWKPSSMTAIGSHATHVAGIITGDLGGKSGSSQFATSSASDPGHDLADGNAPNSQLLYQSLGFANIGIPLDKLLRQSYAGGARVHNNSWGDVFTGDYISYAREADIAMYQRDQLLVVAAAGNSGDEDGCGKGQWRGSRCWTSTGSPGSAKNILSVAALKHGPSLDVDAYSSRGTIDGRFKPDIAAPGTSVVSAANQNNKGVTTARYSATTVALTGTSMASPAITASAALVRQYFTDGFYPSGTRNASDQLAPSAVALKAVLLNGTVPVKDPANTSSAINKGASDWPIIGGGWGRPWLDSNLWFKTTKTGGNDKRRLRLFERSNDTGLKTGEANEHEIGSVRAGEELRVTLTWIDPPTTAGAALTLVNNLDLEVVGPDSKVYRGNQLTASVSTANATGTDVLNNVEQVRLTAPTAGKYTLRVKAANVPGAGSALAGSDRQGYALAASGAFGPAATEASLAAPANLSATARVADATSASLSFDAVANATGYQLYRLEGGCPAATDTGAKAYRLVATGATNNLSDGLIVADKTYGYAVRAVGSDVEGALSACASSAPAAAVAATEPAATAASGG